MAEGVRKIPDPIVEPMAIMVRSKVVSSRLSPLMNAPGRSA